MRHGIRLQRPPDDLDRLQIEVKPQLVPHEAHTFVLPGEQVLQQHEHHLHAICVQAPLHGPWEPARAHRLALQHLVHDHAELRGAHDAPPTTQLPLIESRRRRGEGDMQCVTPYLGLVQRQDRALEGEHDQAGDVDVQLPLEACRQHVHLLKLAVRDQTPDVGLQVHAVHTGGRIGLAHKLHEVPRRNGDARGAGRRRRRGRRRHLRAAGC
mmetsp:Transcript_34228/g.98698  ORF Transcript_34228/g.98698 Transcript_34228/m.98698 type:complete len:211 (+) Transcript_34228:512-1144(+)